LKEYACIQVNHHKEVPKAIADMQNQGWHLHAYQTTGYGADVKHYLLFEKVPNIAKVPITLSSLSLHSFGFVSSFVR